MLYLSDVIIISTDNEQHPKDIENFQITPYAKRAGFELKKSHCLTSKMAHLDQSITPHNRGTIETHTNRLNDMFCLCNLTEIYSFVCISSIYRHVVTPYSSIADLLNQLLEK